jgi:hypothetical protein
LIAGFFSAEVLTFFRENPLFEVLVLTLLLQILWLLRPKQLEDLSVLNDNQTQLELTRLVETERIEHAFIIAAGMVSLNGSIQYLCHAGVRVRVLCQHPETAVDRRDGRRARENVDVIYQLKDERFLSLLEGKFSRDVATVRGILLTASKSQIQHLFIGWYTYSGEPPMISGRRNPVIAVSSATGQGRDLIRFFTNAFEDRWSRPEAEPWPRRP